MDELTIIKIEKNNQIIKVFNEFGSCTNIHYNNEFKIDWTRNDDDCMDFNDNAKWLILTTLEIMKAEANDENMHCDWSAEPEYEFQVKLIKKGENNDN